MKTALVHDWLLGMRGGEKVLEAICGLFPDAEIFTLLHDPGRISGVIEERPIRTSWMQSLPGIRRYYRYLLPLMPGAMEAFDLSSRDLVISSSHCVAKGVRVGPGPSGRAPVHICYCFTPMRYIYDQFDNYFPADSKPLARLGASLFRPGLARWDKKAAAGVDHFIAISECIRKRIFAAYGREAAVIHPPVDTAFFTPGEAGAPRDGEPFFLVAGALVPYKRVDLAIEACRRAGARLKIIGEGNEEKRLRRLARGARVEFLGWQSDEALREAYRTCSALLYPQEEDFGISAVEAMACGRPVIAFGAGGALDTVEEGRTGLFFRRQSAESLTQVIAAFEPARFDPGAIRARAELFSRENFLRRFSDFVGRVLEGRGAPPVPQPISS